MRLKCPPLVYLLVRRPHFSAALDAFVAVLFHAGLSSTSPPIMEPELDDIFGGIRSNGPRSVRLIRKVRKK